MHPRDDRGQLAPLLALFAVGIGLAALGLGRFAGDAVASARARTAADAAALAVAATGDGDDAGLLAEANGATVESFEVVGADVRVRVRVDAGHGARVRASARARSLGPPAAAAGDGGASPVAGHGLAPALRAALARAEQLLGETIPVTSGFRDAGAQRRLWRDRADNPYPVAPPGSSRHEHGLALDVPRAVADRLASVSARSGLCRPYPVTDPVHFELCPAPRGPSVRRLHAP